MDAVNTNIVCVLIYNSINLFIVFKDCFNKHGYNFDNVSKNGYSRHSSDKGILK